MPTDAEIATAAATSAAASAATLSAGIVALQDAEAAVVAAAAQAAGNASLAIAEAARNKRLRILNTLRGSIARTGLRLPGLAATLPTITLPGAAATTIATGTLFTPLGNADRFTFAGADWVQAGPGFPDNTLVRPIAAHTGNGADPAVETVTLQGAARVRFACTAPKLELYLTYGDAENGIRLKVNGEYVRTGRFANTGDGTANGALRYVAIQWGDGTESNRALRFYEIEFGAAGKFGGVRCGPLHTVQAWPQADALRVLVHGDSMVSTIAETGHGAQLNACTLGEVLGQLLGQTDTWLSNVGGTGWYASNGSAFSRFNERVVLDVVTPAPDVIFELGGRNDFALLPSQADMQARVATWLEAVLTAKPETIVFMSAPMIENGGQNTAAGYTILRDAKLAAAATWPKNVAFIDNMARAWLTGASGRVGAPAGLGNRDWVIGTDSAHGSVEGNRYLAWNLASAAGDAIETLIAAQFG